MDQFAEYFLSGALVLFALLSIVMFLRMALKRLLSQDRPR